MPERHDLSFRGSVSDVRPRPTPLDPDTAPPLGVRLHDEGADVAVYAGHADAVDLCLWDADGHYREVTLDHRVHGVHFARVPDVAPGATYGFRARGPWRPREGHRYNPAKLLLDPYARALTGTLRWSPEVFGHVVGDDLLGDDTVPDDRDSAPFVPRAVVVDEGFDWGEDRSPSVPWSSTVVYEAHVRGLTRLLPQVPEQLRGTYAGLAHPATLDHLVGLGVTTVELMPVHAFVSEPALVRRGLSNYWGYNTLGFFAPHAPYASVDDPAAVLREFKGMVRLLHAAGLEVVLDVVFNHTCEQGVDGATLSWRGLDSSAYYRLDGNGRDVDMTGCGNTLDFGHPRVVQLTLDSLRYWVRECHVDGFRFDLATTLARGRDGRFDADHPFLVALRTDPVLSRVKLVAEPWDVGPDGWRTGQFPPPLGEWNDRYRDAVRTFWLRDSARELHGEPAHGVREAATRLAGSQDLFGQQNRGPLSSVNYVASHDGFTLADLTAYDRKHNEANGEDNHDGHDDARSWNHGTEGASDDPAVVVSRHRSVRNLLGTLLLSTGIPMITAGDELGRTQAGNNNAYCQDNRTSWVDWDLQAWQRDLLATTRHLLRLRRELPTLRSRSFFDGRPVHEDGTTDLAWFDAAGALMTSSRWEDSRRRVLQMFVHGDAARATSGAPGDATTGDSLLLVLCGAATDTTVTLPAPPWGSSYLLLWDSAEPVPVEPECGVDGVQYVRARSMRLYAVDALPVTADEPVRA
ncbi:MAG TPA: glycogen debranching protein GlgX [Actinomycetales bacterium]|nr:glycogen debranching protein GlgX [Actinomycetales bacterium]